MVHLDREVKKYTLQITKPSDGLTPAILRKSSDRSSPTNGRYFVNR
jgi:hypothetical protein